MADLDKRTETNFLVYANSVIKSRAIPFAEDNLKPVHRRILWSMYENKIYDDKKTVKCAKVTGNVIGTYHPHGDAAAYGALVHLSQPWKLRYPLITFQGSNGSLLGDPCAAARYTECKLSKIGMMMLEGVNNDAVEFKPNYDETAKEPITLPSRFPYLLCGNNSGIAVGMSSDLVSHNFTEVAAAIRYYMEHKDCSVADLMQYIKGPDFPTKGQIVNGENLLSVYSSGQGSVKVRAHYDISKNGSKTLITFHDIPYGVEITDGILAPLKKLVIEDGYEVFEDFYAECKEPKLQYYDIVITLSKNANVAECLNILFAKTGLESTIKINQTLIVDGEPKLLSLKQLISYWVNYRSDIIKRIAKNDYEKTNHKLTVTLGLQKCMSDIDKLVSLIRNSESRADAKIKIMKEFVLNDEQAEAVLDMKLSSLSRLDLTQLNEKQKELESTLAALKAQIDDENIRFDMIKKDLDSIKREIGEDKRLTEIIYNQPVEGIETPVVKKEFIVYDTKVVAADQFAGGGIADGNVSDVVFAYKESDIIVYSNQELGAAAKFTGAGIVGAFAADASKDRVVAVTKDGYIKVSSVKDYRFGKNEKVMKLKDNDELVYVGLANDNDFLFLWNGEKLLKLEVKELPIAGKLTIGVKSGFETVVSAHVVSDSDLLICMTKDNKTKLTPVKDFNINSRGNEGQGLTDDTVIIRYFDNARENIYLFPKVGKPLLVGRNKVSIKSRTSVGASVTNRVLVKLV